jgi:hypothetical protein
MFLINKCAEHCTPCSVAGGLHVLCRCACAAWPCHAHLHLWAVHTCMAGAALMRNSLHIIKRLHCLIRLGFWLVFRAPCSQTHFNRTRPSSERVMCQSCCTLHAMRVVVRNHYSPSCEWYATTAEAVSCQAPATFVRVDAVACRMVVTCIYAIS